MAQPFTDNEQSQQDRSAERQVRDAEWRACKPTKNAEVDKVRAAVADYLATPASFPLVCMKETLEQQHSKQLGRRFSDEPVAITGFGAMA